MRVSFEREHCALRLNWTPATEGVDERLLVTQWSRGPEGQVAASIALWPEDIERLVEFVGAVRV